MENRCGCAFFVDIAPPIIVRKRLPRTCSVFNSELYAIYRALLYVKDSEFQEFVIFSDSLSALQFLENSKMDHRIKLNIHRLLNNCHKSITFEWVAGHSGIAGNDISDSAAKESLNNNTIVKLPLLFNDYKSLITKIIFDQWQLKWTSYNGRLKTFKPILGDWKSAYRKSRKEEKILSRLRTDSCFFRIQNFLDPIKYNKDYCNLCNLYTTVDHILCKCPRFQRYRLRMISDLDINPLDLTEAHILNDDFNHDKLFKYLKDIDYYNRI